MYVSPTFRMGFDRQGTKHFVRFLYNGRLGRAADRSADT